MANIVIADDGIEFDGNSLRSGPLGGVESSLVNLAEELAKREHKVIVLNMVQNAKTVKGVEWKPLSMFHKYSLPRVVDLYIANRGDKLINLIPKAKKTVFWIHNPAKYLMKWRYLSKLWKHKPEIIFIGDYHATTYPSWAPGGDRVVIPYGISSEFCSFSSLRDIPPRRAIFTSNPLRSLDWLMGLWVEKIFPAVPDAELHLFTGPSTYGKTGAEKKIEMELILKEARSYSNKGIVLRGPVSKSELIKEFRNTRVMLYRGDLNETFCLAVGEAQASGVPAIVQNCGSVVERVINGKTGTITETDSDFVEKAIELLKDDELWKNQHQAAIKEQRAWSWRDAAMAFEELLVK